MNLHQEIMNIRVDTKIKENDYTNVDGCVDSAWISYKEGHRDARHAAAELSLKAEARIEALETYLNKTETAYNAVIDYMLGKGYMESPLEFLRCWNEGNFEALREEWLDAPEEIYLADPLYKGKK